MPPPRRDHTGLAAEALIAVAPLATLWIERLLARHEPPLTLPQYLALRSIATEDVTGAELARRTGVSGPAVSQLLAGLVEAGLVERAEFAQDRRRNALTLTATGSAAFRSARAVLREQLAAMLTGLPRPEIDALARLLPSVDSILLGAPPPRRPHKPPKPHKAPNPKPPRPAER